jgi:hypothetical protein
MDDSNNNNSSSNNNHNRRNDDETIKAILSRLSNNDKIVEEVRQLVAENLQLGSRSSSGSSSTKNNDTPLIAAAAPPSLSRTHSSSSTAGTAESKEVVAVNENINATRVQTSSSSSSRQSKSKTNDDKESEELAFTIDKDSETYHNILSMAKWYRDSFFIGSEYANVNQQQRQQLQQHQHQHQQGIMNQSPGQKEDEDQRRKRVSLLQQQRDYEKRQQHQLLNNSNNVTPLRRYRPPQITSYTPTPPITSPHNATGYPILSTLFENYITSPYAYNTVHPYATWITSSYGPLYPIASTSLSQSIPLGQSLLNWTCRENVLWLLQDEEWKDWGKSITRGYIMDSDSVGDSSGSDD